MKVKTLIAAAAITISGAFATGAVAAEKAPTEVTIKAQSGGFFGYVKSPDQNHCEADRKVTVYKLTGESPDPSVDKKVGSDTASPNGPDSMWSTGNSGQTKGKFYARVRSTTDCQGDISPVVKAQN